MSSVLIPVFNKQRFEFSFLGTSGSQQVVLQPAIDVIAYDSLFLLVRIHSITITTGQSFNFKLYNTLPSEEDPQEFTDTTAGSGQVLSLDVPAGTTAPKLLSASGNSPQAFVKLVFTANQNGTGGTILYAEMSGCLLGRIR